MSYILTTVDNPFDPRSEFKAWDQWDRAQGYNTSAYLDRVAGLPDELPEVVIDKMRDDVILEILEIHGGEIYKALDADEEVPSSPSTAA